MSSAYDIQRIKRCDATHSEGADAKGMCHMKEFILLGVFVHMAAFAAVELDPQIGDIAPFLLGFVSGGIGHLAHMSFWPPTKDTPLKTQIFVGGFLSAIAGPLLTQVFVKWMPEGVNARYMLMGISFTAGLGGVHFIKAYGPGILERLGSASFKKVEELAGTPPVSVQPNDDSTKRMIRELSAKVDKMTESGDVPKPE